jgi:hypothetical protein
MAALLCNHVRNQWHPSCSVTPEEKKAKRAEYMRRWRAANPERTLEIARETMARWRERNPEESRSYTQKWRDEHPESLRQTQIRQNQRQKRLRATDAEWREAANDRAKVLRDRFKGIPETELQARFQTANPHAISMDRVRPDFYVPGDGFVEIKRALPYLSYGWRITSVHFPGLFFFHGGWKRFKNNIDNQLAAQPRPLLVIIYHALTGEEITRKLLI